MTNELKQFRSLTSGFPEIKETLDEYNSLNKKLRSFDRKLKTLETKYGFLNDLTSIDGKDLIIETATKRFFKSAGFDEVRHLKNVRTQREDLQIWCEDCLILVECKGTYRTNIDDKSLGQIKKYIDHRKQIIETEKPVFGLTIVNHDNKKHVNQRNKRPFDQRKDEYAIAGQYGIVTTAERVKGFVLLKTKNITFEQFKNTIKQFGIIKFGVRAEKP